MFERRCSIELKTSFVVVLYVLLTLGIIAIIFSVKAPVVIAERGVSGYGNDSCRDSDGGHKPYEKGTAS